MTMIVISSSLSSSPSLSRHNMMIMTRYYYTCVPLRSCGATIPKGYFTSKKKASISTMSSVKTSSTTTATKATSSLLSSTISSLGQQKQQHHVLPMALNVGHNNHHHYSLLRRYASTLADDTKKSTTNSSNLTLYQYAICPFCNIVKSVLHYHKIPYNAIEVNPLTKRELNELPKDYRKVPILTLPQQQSDDDNTKSQNQYNGSEQIVEYLVQSSSNSNDNNNIPNDEHSQKWVLYAREELAPLLYPNICQTWSNAYQTMGYIHQKDQFSTVQKYSIQWIGSLAMYLAASKIKKKRQITDERKALYDTLQEWEDYLNERKTTATTTTNNVTLGDLSIYGVLRGLNGLPIHSDINKDFVNISVWYKNMEAQVEG